MSILPDLREYLLLPALLLTDTCNLSISHNLQPLFLFTNLSLRSFTLKPPTIYTGKIIKDSTRSGLETFPPCRARNHCSTGCYISAYGRTLIPRALIERTYYQSHSCFYAERTMRIVVAHLHTSIDASTQTSLI